MKNDKKEKKKTKKIRGETTPEIDENAAETDSADLNARSELRQPVWSVVSFEQCAAKNLTYAEAEQKIAELDEKGVSGLCLVTDSVAERIAKS